MTKYEQKTNLTPEAIHMDVDQKRNSWQVLLIGGSSGVGKTLVAHQLAQRLAISLLLVDDIRLALQKATTFISHPELHIFLNYQLEQWQDAETIRDDWLVIGQALRQPLQAIMEHHISVPNAGRIILEGDGILPVLGLTSSYSDLMFSTNTMPTREIRAVFIVEEDERQLLRNLRARGRGFENGNQAEQESFAHASWLFGQWLNQEARAIGLPVVASQPFQTLSERILQVIL